MPSTSKLWAITSYFNPAGFESRLQNYRVFRERLDLPLLAVELIHGGDGELSEMDAEKLIRLRGGDVLWQKERLLNVALSALPDDCEFVAWLDCDIVFERREWAADVCRSLESNVVVHPLNEIFDVPRGTRTFDRGEVGARRATNSLVRNWVTGYINRQDIAEAFTGGFGGRSRSTSSKKRIGTAGLGWAGRRDVLQEHGLYDAFVVGGGDGGFISAALGLTDLEIQKKRIHPEHIDHYLRWAEPFERSVAGRVGALEGGVFHLWHGELENRRYWQRHHDFAQFEFDPHLDITLAPQGCWRWSSAKPDMHRFVRGFFEGRREDG